ncbi:MAG TPA: formylmethanofuran dehydrogenase subunit B [Isosphaeraceae bacterium]|jgi:formylmethanofuran dehydrogenase subunit B|nr:formylmethanofuran dehydrogenase subunit B [Isosphaeraceae bacterium]
MGETTRTPGPSRVEDATCLACGCLCDDINLVVEGGRIVAAENACATATAWFLADHARDELAPAMIEGQAAGVDEALDRAAAILDGARSPAVLGLGWTGVDTQRMAVALADRLGARLDLGHDPGPVLAFQRVGRVTATLGEVRARADVVVFWQCDPMTTHPRHWGRYSVAPRGRFTPEGRAGRTVVVLDDGRPNATAALADHHRIIPHEDRFRGLWTLRSIVRGEAVEDDRLREVSATLLGARYGAVFVGPGATSQAEAEALALLVRDLNGDGRRFVLLDLGAPANAAGAEAVLSWQTGFPLGVDFGTGVPRFLAAEGTGLAGIDAALIVADDPGSTLIDGLGHVPSVLIAPDATARVPAATVALRSATPGIDAPGVVARVDGPWLPLRPALSTPLPTDLTLLRALAVRLGPPIGGS